MGTFTCSRHLPCAAGVFGVVIALLITCSGCLFCSNVGLNVSSYSDVHADNMFMKGHTLTHDDHALQSHLAAGGVPNADEVLVSNIRAGQLGMMAQKRLAKAKKKAARTATSDMKAN